jgi:hypothetical protein
MAATLKRLGDLEVVPSPGDSKFVRPQTIFYHLDGGPASLQLPSLQFPTLSWHGTWHAK